VYRSQSEAAWLISAGLAGDEAERLVAAERLLYRHLEVPFPFLREAKPWIQGRVEGVELTEQRPDCCHISLLNPVDRPFSAVARGSLARSALQIRIGGSVEYRDRGHRSPAFRLGVFPRPPCGSILTGVSLAGSMAFTNRCGHRTGHLFRRRH